MRRLSLGLLLTGFLLLCPAAAGAAEIWTPADKHGFGTAHDLRSKVWFTLGDTRMDEVYWPDVGTPAVRSLEFRVGGERETAAAVGRVEPADPRSLTYRQISTARSGEWRITKTYATDPARDALLVDVDVRSLNGRPLHVAVDFDPALDNGGADDAGRVAGGTLLDVRR